MGNVCKLEDKGDNDKDKDKLITPQTIQLLSKKQFIRPQNCTSKNQQMPSKYTYSLAENIDQDFSIFSPRTEEQHQMEHELFKQKEQFHQEYSEFLNKLDQETKSHYEQMINQVCNKQDRNVHSSQKVLRPSLKLCSFSQSPSRRTKSNKKVRFEYQNEDCFIFKKDLSFTNLISYQQSYKKNRSSKKECTFKF